MRAITAAFGLSWWDIPLADSVSAAEVAHLAANPDFVRGRGYWEAMADASS
jgi:hypothetical protein